MKKLTLLLSIMYCCLTTAQVGIGTNTPDESAVLELYSDTKGFLIPQLTSTARDQINNGNIAEGLMIYNTDSKTLEIFDGTQWNKVMMEKVEEEVSNSIGIENGDFENWIGGELQSWTLGEGITREEENAVVFSENKSVKVVLKTSSQELTDFRQKIQLENGEYHISFYVYHLDEASRVRLYVDGFKNYSNPVLINQWQEVQYDFSITENKEVEIGFRFYDTDSFVDSSVIYLDKVELIKK